MRTDALCYYHYPVLHNYRELTVSLLIDFRSALCLEVAAAAGGWLCIRDDASEPVDVGSNRFGELEFVRCPSHNLSVE